MRTWLSIRYKFLFVTTLLLTFCVVCYLALAAHIFKRDKTELVYDLNRSSVANIASDLDNLFNSLTDKMKLVAVLSQDASPRSQAIIADLFQNESDIVFLASSSDFQNINKNYFSDAVFNQTYSIDSEYYTQTLLQNKPIPFQTIQMRGEAIWNASQPNGPPLIGFGKNIIPELSTETTKAPPFAIVAFVRADRILESFAQSQSNTLFAMNQNGEILIHRDPKWMHQAPSTEHPLFTLAKSQPLKTGVAQFKVDGGENLGAFSKAYHEKIYLLSEVSGKKAFSAVDRLLQRSLLFGLIVVTLAFLAAILFSRSLTQPLYSLVEAMARVANGDMQTQIQIRTKDEIAVLAHSFNKMILDLRDSRAKLEEANRDLEQKVKDRTHKLEEQNQTVKRQQEALLQTTRLAAAGEIAGRAAHEVLNPLTSILTRLEKVKNRILQRPKDETHLLREIHSGWEKDYKTGGLQLLQKSWASPSKVLEGQTLFDEDLQNLGQIGQNLTNEWSTLVSDTDFLIKEGGRINKIVHGMRSFTAIKGELKPCSIQDLVHESINVMADLCSAHDIQIDCELTHQNDHVKVDPDEFIQCTTNLLRNSIHAVNAMRAKLVQDYKGRILLKTQDQGDKIILDVIDNGVGIGPEVQNKLFDSQFSTKSIEEGTGLGLGIARRFIRAYGGDLTLQFTAPGEGCIFRIHLPGQTTGSNLQRKTA